MLNGFSAGSPRLVNELPALEGGSKTRKDFLVFGKPHFGPEETQELLEVLKSGWVGTGPRTATFEKEFAAYTGAAHAIAVNSCTAALQLAVAGLNLNADDEVIVPALTFCATANAVIHAGGTPAFADVDEDSLCVTRATLEKAFTKKTRAIIVVHFAGRSCPMDEIMAFANEHGLKVIEDAAHAVETMWNGKHAGTYGWAGCFSFYANKNVSTGEGGMLITNDPAFAERGRKLSLHGLSKDAHKRFSAAGYQHYEHDEYGYKFNMPDIAAALGIHQLRRVEENRKLREAIWATYNEGLRDLPIKLPVLPKPGSPEAHAYHLYQLRVPAPVRDKMLSAFAAEGIGIGVHYRAMTRFPIYKKFVRPGQTFPVSERFGDETISIPVGTAMTIDDAKDVVRATVKLARYYIK